MVGTLPCALTQGRVKLTRIDDEYGQIGHMYRGPAPYFRSDPVSDFKFRMSAGPEPRRKKGIAKLLSKMFRRVGNMRAAVSEYLKRPFGVRKYRHFSPDENIYLMGRQEGGAESV